MTDIYLPFGAKNGSPAALPEPPAGRRLVIDPVTRIEGHLRIEAEVSNGQVSEAWSAGTMFRGLESVLLGRDPREAWLLAQRMCGVCTTVHALASVRAVENALGVSVPPNAELIRNLMAGAQYLQDHVVHFYHLHAPDWVDVGACLDADPADTSALAVSISEWPNRSAEHFAEVQERLRRLVVSGQIGIFGHAYWGHPAYALTPEADLLLLAHYLEALDWQRQIVQIQALLGGKNPHPQTYLVGGMALPIDPAGTTGIGRSTIATLRRLLSDGRAFVELVYVPDLLLLCGSYSSASADWSRLGSGCGSFMAYGDFAAVAGGGEGSAFVPRGVVWDRQVEGAPESLDPSSISEWVTHSWYADSVSEDAARHPSQGETDPRYAGPPPPYDYLDTDGKYSWLKAPRYADAVVEVGPLARMAVGYAARRAPVREAIDGALAALGWQAQALFSTLGRTLARGLETRLMADQMTEWLETLSARMEGGDTVAFEGARWDPSTWPTEAVGWGAVEAPRGALGHWLAIRDGKIARYQAVAPSTWNGSPRDGAGRRGPWEEALVGTPIADPSRPIEVLRTVHSFDPCLACAVHLVHPARTSDRHLPPHAAIRR